MKTIAMAVLVVMAFWVVTVEAQTVRYVDERGGVHYVGSPAQIPEQYRTQATARSLNKRLIETSGPDRVAGSSDPAGEETTENPAQGDGP